MSRPSRLIVLSLIAVSIGSTALLALVGSPRALAQVVGGLPAYVKLQATSPGTAQTGHSNITGTSIAGQFQGGGVGLSGLNADNLASGTVSDARLSSNVALLGSAQTFTSLKTFGVGLKIPTGAGTGKVLTSDATGNANWSTGAAPTGSASGDLGGSYPSPSVVALQGRSVSTTAPTSGQVLKWNGVWAPASDGISLPYIDSLNSAGTALLSFDNTSSSANSVGIWGSSSASSGATFGVGGQSASSGGTGIYGNATSATGTNYGVYGQTQSATGYGGYFVGRGYFSGKVGIGVANPSLALEVNGAAKMTGFNMSTLAAPGRILTSDINGNGSWADLSLSGILAGGDLGGTLLVPFVKAIQGRAVSATAPTNGQVLSWNGTAWIPATSGFSLPFIGSGSSSGAALGITNTGTGPGVVGTGKNGVEGSSISTTDSGVWGHNDNGGNGVSGSTNSLVAAGTAGVWGNNDGNGIGVKGTAGATGFAGYFSGRGYFSGNVGVGTTSPAERLHVAGGNLQIDDGFSLKFSDNGEIRSQDDKHRILFRRSENKLELREFGDLVFSPGATTGAETATVSFKSDGTVGIGPSNLTSRQAILTVTNPGTTIGPTIRGLVPGAANWDGNHLGGKVYGVIGEAAANGTASARGVWGGALSGSSTGAATAVDARAEGPGSDIGVNCSATGGKNSTGLNSSASCVQDSNSSQTAKGGYFAASGGSENYGLDVSVSGWGHPQGKTYGVRASVGGPDSTCIGGYFTNSGPLGIGLWAGTTDTTGSTVAIQGTVSSPNGFAGSFDGGRGVRIRAGGQPTDLTITANSYFGVLQANTATLDIPGTGDLGIWDNCKVNNVFTAGTKNFEIDHPQDPFNFVLRHGCIESDAYRNLYDGTVKTDAKGYATVTMPTWFESLNETFRYQLTVVEEADSPDFVQAKVAQKLKNGSFRIRTSKPNTEVCWQVTGVRKDAFALANPLVVESAKSKDFQGKLMHPEAYAKAKSKRP